MQSCCRASGNEPGSGDLMANRDKAQLGPSVDGDAGQSREQPDGAREGRVFAFAPCSVPNTLNSALHQAGAQRIPMNEEVAAWPL